MMTGVDMVHVPYRGERSEEIAHGWRRECPNSTRTSKLSRVAVSLRLQCSTHGAPQCRGQASAAASDSVRTLEPEARVVRDALSGAAGLDTNAQRVQASRNGDTCFE